MLAKKNAQNFMLQNHGKRAPRRSFKYVPAAFIVEEHHVKVYAGPDDRFVKGERPKDAFPGSIATPELVSGIFNSKYVNGMPVARIEKDFERMEINIRRQTMCRLLGTR